MRATLCAKSDTREDGHAMGRRTGRMRDLESFLGTVAGKAEQMFVGTADGRVAMMAAMTADHEVACW